MRKIYGVATPAKRRGCLASWKLAAGVTVLGLIVLGAVGVVGGVVYTIVHFIAKAW